MTIHQISVFLENRAGQLAEIAQVLSENGIDLRAIHIAETSDYGVLRMIASRPREAADILRAHGFVLSMTPVTAVSVPDRPGGLAQLLRPVVESQTDIEYMYSMFGQRDGRAAMILRVADPDKLETILTAGGFPPALPEELGVQ